MSLDLGALVGRVILDISNLVTNYAKAERMMSDLGTVGEKSALGVGKLDEQLALVGKSADTASTALARAAKSETDTAATSDKATIASRNNAAAMTKVAALLASIADESPRVQAALLRQSAAQERLAELQQSGTATARQLEAANASLISSTRAVATAQDAEAESSDRARTAMSGALKTAGELGLAVGAFELIKQGIDITKEAISYQALMTRIQTETGASTGEVKSMSAALLQMAGPLGTSPLELAKSLYAVESAGYRGRAALDIVTDGAKLAKIGNSDLTQTTDALVGVLQTGLTGGAKNVTQTVALMNATVGAGKLTMQGYVDALGTGIAASAKTFGVSMQSMGAALALMTDEGTPPTQSATRLRMAMTLLAAPTALAGKLLTDTGLSSADAGKQVSATQILLQKAGVTTTQLATDLRKPDGFLVALQDLKSHMQAAGLTADEQAALIARAFGGGRTAAPILAMYANLDLLQQKFNAIGSGASKFGDDWETTEGTVKFALARTGADFEAAGIKLADKLLPSVKDAATWLGTTLPHDLATLQHTLEPVEHEVGEVLVTAWNTATGALRAASGVLGGMGHTLAEHRGLVTDVVTPVLAMWAAWKGFTILSTVAAAMRFAITSMGTSVAIGSEQAGLWGRTWMSVLTGTGRDVQLTAAIMEAEFADIAAAATAEAAEIAAAAASIDESLAGEAIAAQATADEMAASAAVAADAVVAAGEEASLGWTAMLGPIGLVAVGIAAVATLFGHSGSDAAAAAAQVNTYTDAIKVDSGALAENTRQAVASALQKSGALDAANKLGLSLPTVTDAILGNADAQSELNSVLDQYTQQGVGQRAGNEAQLKAALILQGAIGGQSSAIKGAVSAYKNETSAAGASTGAVTALGNATTTTATATNALTAEQTALAKAIANVADTSSESGDALLSALSTFASSAGTDADRAALIGATLKAANGDALNFASQMNAAATAANTFGEDVATNATKAAGATRDTKAENEKYLASIVSLKDGTIDYSNEAAAPLISDLQSMQTAAMNAAEAQFQHAKAIGEGSTAADQAYKVYQSQTSGQLIDEATKLGLTKTQAKKLSDAYFGMPKNVKTAIEAEGTNPIVTVLDKIGKMLAELTGQPWDVAVEITTRLKDVATSTTAASNVGHRDGNTGSKVFVGPTVKAAVVKSSAAPSSLDEHSLTSAVMSANTAGNPNPITEFNGGVASSGSTAPKTSTSSGTGGTVNGISYSTAQATRNAQVRLAQQVVKDVAAFSATLGKTASDISTASSTLLTAAKAAGLSTAQLAAAEKARTVLLNAVNLRDKDQAALTAAKSKLATDQAASNAEVNTVRSAALGSFDITTAGANPVTGAITGAGILAQGQQAKNNALTWAADLKKLRGEGLGQSFYQQLAEGGPADLPEVLALMQLNLGQIKQLNADNTSIAASGTAVGKSVASMLFGGTIALDQKSVNALAHAVALAIASIKIDGQKLATLVDNGTQKNGRRA